MSKTTIQDLEPYAVLARERIYDDEPKKQRRHRLLSQTLTSDRPTEICDGGAVSFRVKIVPDDDQSPDDIGIRTRFETYCVRCDTPIKRLILRELLV